MIRLAFKERRTDYSDFLLASNDMWAAQMRYIADTLKSRGAIFCITCTIVALSCLIKSLILFCKYTVRILSGETRNYIKNLTEEEIAYLDFMENVKDSNALLHEDYKKYAKHDTYKSRRKQLSLKTSVIMDRLDKNEDVIKGAILKTVFKRISSDTILEHLESNTPLPKSYITQRVTFGKELNEAIKYIIPSVKLRKLRGKDDNYLLLEDTDSEWIEKELQRIFMNECIKIRLRTCPVVK